MKVTINRDECVGCAACSSVCPDCFEMDDEGKAIVTNDANCDCVQDAIDSCPTQCIIAE